MSKNKFWITWLIFIHLLIIVVLLKSDFISRVKARLGYTPELTEHYHQMRAFHQRMDASIPDQAVLFIGDSITQGLAVSAVSPLSVNLGIGTDTTLGVIDRLKSMTALHRASLLVIAIGYNDLKRRDNDEIVKHYDSLLRALPRTVPVIVSAVLPVAGRQSEPKKRLDAARQLNQRINKLNQSIAELCTHYPRIRFINAGKSMLNDEAELAENLHTGDGIHLNDAGYAIWIKALKKAVAEHQSTSLSNQ